MVIILCCRYFESLMWSKRFLYGSAHVLKQPLFRQACELAFVECYTGGNHYITEQELGDSIRQAIPNMDEFEHFSLPS
ncbi:hypothetical protein CsSME_00012619 [Camellia sinensis var. sinensis]